MARKSGSIVAKGDRKWLVRWFVGESSDGKRRYASKTIHGTKREAQGFLNEQLRNQDLGLAVVLSRETLNQHLDSWLDSKRDVEPRTRDGYRENLSRYVRPTLGNLRLDQIRIQDVDEWVGCMVSKGLSARTIRIVAAPLRSALTEAVRWGKIPSNPAQYAKFPKQTRTEVRVLNREEVALFRVKAKGSPHALFFDFLLSTGVRPGEARAIRWKDVVFGDGVVVICQAVSKDSGRLVIKEPKTAGARRRLPLPAPLVDALRQHRVSQRTRALRMGSVYDRSADLVFANEVGAPLCDRNLTQRYLKPILKDAGLSDRITLYSLRHTHATLMLSEQVHPKVAAERLGHSTTRQTLDTYSHVLPGMQEEATRKIEALLYGSK